MVSLELRPVDGAPAGVGELVYRGPNVMLGYGTEQSDLALGATLDELATGDLARYDALDDVFEIVGRRSRFVKPFGLRIDLDAVEAELAAGGLDAVATGDDELLVVGAPGASRDDVTQRVSALTGLPAAAIHVDTATVPRGRQRQGRLPDPARPRGPRRPDDAGGCAAFDRRRHVRQGARPP